MKSDEEHAEERIPPQDLEAERQIIGSAILAPETIDLAASRVRSDQFYADENRRLFAALVEMRDAGTAIDATTLVDKLRSTGELDVIGGPGYLAQIVHGTPTSQHVAYHAAIVAKHATRRAIIQTGHDAVNAARNMSIDPADTVAMIDAQLQLLGTTSKSGDPVPVSELVPDVLERIEKAAKNKTRSGILTGLYVLDASTGGVFPGELIVLAARPGIGKTSLACQIAHHVATRRTVYMASLEMEDRELVTRILCSLGGVSSKRVRGGNVDAEDIKALGRSGHELASTRLVIHDSASLTVYDIRRACRKLAQRDLGMAVIDYLGLIGGNDQRKKRYEQIGDTCKALKAMSRELGIPVLLLCQLNRATETATNQKAKRPRLHNLRESGDIEQTADMVWLLHRDDPQTAEEKVTKTLLDVAKNRNGETGGVWIEWEASRTRYTCALPSNYCDEFDG